MYVGLWKIPGGTNYEAADHPYRWYPRRENYRREDRSWHYA